MTPEDIERIASSQEKENLTIELKSKLIFTNKDGADKLLEEIVAFANTRGGMIIIGLDDNGCFEGRIDNVDKNKGTILNKCKDKASPPIEVTTEFISCSEGDVLVIHIPKKRNIPHAIVNRLESGVIKSRTYFIRTSHGKSHVTDTQLSWLFNYEESANFVDKFRVAIEYDKFLADIGCDKPRGNSWISSFTQYLSIEDIEKYFDNWSKYLEFWRELIPYAILYSVFSYYEGHWYIGTEEDFGRRHSGPMIESKNIPDTKILVSDIPHNGLNHLLSYPWDFKKILNDLMPDPISIPLNSEISISVDSSVSSIKLNHSSFKFEIKIGMLRGGSGLHKLNPSFEIMNGRFGISEAEKYGKGISHYDGAGYFIADFEFPEQDYNSYEKYLHYAKTISELLRYHWDYNVKRNELPGKDFLIMHSKVNDILTLLQSKAKD